MKISKYGIILSRQRIEDTGFVLQKLQSSDLDPVMAPKEDLSYEQQQDWFFNLNKPETCCFLVECNAIKIGILTAKNINWEAATSELEFYYWDETARKGLFPILASLALLKTGFHYLSWNKFSAKANPADNNLISQLLILGFELSGENENGSVNIYQLSATRFETTYQKLIEEITNQVECDTSEGYLLLEPVDYESGIAQLIENNFLESGVYLHRRGISGSRMYFR